MINDEIPPLTFHVSQEHIQRYAEASGDFNPLHIDEAFAKNTTFKGTIAHGLMTLAFVSQWMNGWNWKRWMFGGEMDIKFIAPVRPGDQITVKGKIIEKGVNDPFIRIELDVANQKGDRIISGTTNMKWEDKRL